MRPPCGETFFGHPTGRTTDGRVILDLVAQSLGLPLVPPSLAHNGSSSFFRHGANFAVTGATTLDAAFYHARGIPSAARRQQACHQHQLERAAGVVRGVGALAVRHTPRVQGVLRQIPLLRGRVRGQRLPPVSEEA
ncbi:unnamed protein product [Urochloa humidicola]